MHNDKLRGDNSQNWEQSALQVHRDIPKNLKSKGVTRKVEIRNIIRYEFKRN